MMRVKGGLVSSRLNADARSSSCPARAVYIFDGAHKREASDTTVLTHSSEAVAERPASSPKHA
jgi:hypothetical protein